MRFADAPIQTAALDAGAIRYRDVGSGPPLLFVHGFAVNGWLWRGVVDRLSDSFRCVVPDWPLGSHSVPMREDAELGPPALAALVVAFADAIGLPSFTLVGNDLGGAISQIAATRHPERIDRLVLTSCDAFGNFPPPLFTYLVHLPRLRPIRFAMAQAMRLRALRRLPVTYGWLSKQGLSDDTLERYLAPMIGDPGVRRDAAKVITKVAPRHTREVIPALRRFRRPVLLAWSREDRFFPFTHAEELAELIPDATLHPIDDAYTLAAEDQPEALASAIRGFMS